MRPTNIGLLVMLAGALIGAENQPDQVKPEVAKPKVGPAASIETTPEATQATRQPDPTAAIVAEGKYVYRQRDLDALALIAMRHAKVRLAKADEERLRETLTTALLAREPLLDAIATLPGGFSGPVRDALVLDLLDFQAEPAKAPTAPPPITAGTPAAAPAQPTTNSGPLFIRLPPLTLARTLPGVGKRHLSLTIALFFRDPTLAQKLQDRAPLVQDAILSHVQALPPAQFVEPNQLTLKDGITAAILDKVPEFPPDAVLIPQMDTREVAEAKTPAGPAPADQPPRPTEVRP